MGSQARTLQRKSCREILFVLGGIPVRKSVLYYSRRFIRATVVGLAFPSYYFIVRLFFFFFFFLFARGQLRSGSSMAMESAKFLCCRCCLGFGFWVFGFVVIISSNKMKEEYGCTCVYCLTVVFWTQCGKMGGWQ